MVEQEKKVITFNCWKCNQHNDYVMVVYVGSAPDGTSAQVLKCKNCGSENKIMLQGYTFPNNRTITRGD